MEITGDERENFVKLIKSTLDTHSWISDVEKNIEVFEHEFKWSGHRTVSKCRVWIFSHSESKQKVVVFEDLAHGTSVTNASEQIATEVCYAQVGPQGMYLHECYPYNEYPSFPIDAIKYQVNGSGELYGPEWKAVGNNTFLEFLRRTIGKVGLKAKDKRH